MKAAVLFSGGADSTLAAYKALEKYDEVYLISYLHGGMFFHDKIAVNIDKLKNHFSSKKIIYRQMNISKTFREFYLRQFLKELLKHGSIYVSWVCGACKLAMHLKTIDFCKRNNIQNAYCGANKESKGIFPVQMQDSIDLLKRIYRESGINYQTPVYEIDRTDAVLHSLGIISKNNIKSEMLFYSTQHTCYLGLLLHAHSRLYYKPFYGESAYIKKASQLFREKTKEIINKVMKDEHTGNK